MSKWGSPVVFALVLLAVDWRAYGQDLDLADALDDATEKPKPKPKPPTRNTGGDLDLADFFDTPIKTTKKPPRPFTRAPPKKPDPNDFDLSDALDEKNDGKGGSDISDSDLDDIFGDGYHPDKKKDGRGGGKAGGPGDDDGTNSGFGNQAETGTIAGIASALAMALIGAVSSYISYQQKKFCFSIQEGLNAEQVKGEHMEAVVSEEPQVKYSALESQSAVPLTEDANV
ncbi:hypothetical protein GDO86_015296 [Hymenochirus boettgeri]|uniref:CD99 antigen-like protein 2 n=1 Tax=Hymenochirus boettgeri TaxID=247094 RepID=A0A8T2JY69_9PIPI|nr:hypothetical protein GDO86_015296 [Hymenochirus boettgeri]